jgi:hypothetical protein
MPFVTAAEPAHGLTTAWSWSRQGVLNSLLRFRDLGSPSNEMGPQERRLSSVCRHEWNTEPFSRTVWPRKQGTGVQEAWFVTSKQPLAAISNGHGELVSGPGTDYQRDKHPGNCDTRWIATQDRSLRMQ